MSKPDLRVQKTEKALANALIELLQQFSFTEITIDQICQQAIVGRSTFYNHYVDKYELMAKISNDEAQHFDQLLHQRLVAPVDDDLLIYLYHELYHDRRTILTLLKIKTPGFNLTQQFLTSLTQYSQPLIAPLSAPVPSELLQELYATNALTAITWSLIHNDPTEVATFMNTTAKTLLQKYQPTNS
ncbi:TetR/AcrR family transcriptional regulator [Lapidilactobacillus wuchangensis]|uniref:TetR/AcrR family transcriptional regulator n=1 Tax=Lapidilactobacillus wuchangensis TaxID=2486001 RepID=UPI000F797C28|nr:TetR/AcrR family transcriptional regulator [Lapidilactobacillus wuchangensis]